MAMITAVPEELCPWLKKVVFFFDKSIFKTVISISAN